MHSVATDGISLSRDSISRIWTGIHLAEFVEFNAKNHGARAAQASLYSWNFPSCSDLTNIRTAG